MQRDEPKTANRTSDGAPAQPTHSPSDARSGPAAKRLVRLERPADAPYWIPEGELWRHLSPTAQWAVVDWLVPAFGCG